MYKEWGLKRNVEASGEENTFYHVYTYAACITTYRKKKSVIQLFGIHTKKPHGLRHTRRYIQEFFEDFRSPSVVEKAKAFFFLSLFTFSSPSFSNIVSVLPSLISKTCHVIVLSFTPLPFCKSYPTLRLSYDHPQNLIQEINPSHMYFIPVSIFVLLPLPQLDRQLS